MNKKIGFAEFYSDFLNTVCEHIGIDVETIRQQIPQAGSCWRLTLQIYEWHNFPNEQNEIIGLA